jgi:hypothetical protein
LRTQSVGCVFAKLVVIEHGRVEMSKVEVSSAGGDCYGCNEARSKVKV